MVQAHIESQSIATLAVQKRESSRQLLFDEKGQLCGRRSARDSGAEIVYASQHLEPLAFSGIHVISPRLLTMVTESGAFSIIDTYLRLAKQGETISAFRADECYWRDLGKPENVRLAANDLADRGASI
jgi:NDP-sugar pyrophosphorylase family protein